MSRTEKYRGIFPAFYACYEEDGSVSGERAKQFTGYLMEKGVQGLYVGGSSGECIYQSVEERKLLLENVMEAAGGKLVVIAHVACNNTRDSVELAAHAQSLGVDAIASIPPIYFHLPEYAIAEYWNTISAGAPDTDFIIYNIPQLAGVSLTLPLLQKMRENPRVIGVKNSSMPVQDIQIFRAAGGEDWVVFNGPDEQFVSGRARQQASEAPTQPCRSCIWPWTKRSGRDAWRMPGSCSIRQMRSSAHSAPAGRTCTRSSRKFSE